jgi:hypothetical protein
VPRLTDSDIAFYRDNGWIIVNDALNVDVPTLQKYVTEVSQWGTDGEWLHHFERTETGPQLARTENFTPFHSGMHQLLREGALVEIAGELLGEAAVLYKEKINYKLPNGAGFSPHQDKPAYPFVDRILSVMVAVDDATVENGCLEVVDARHDEVLAQDERGCITSDVVAEMTWHHVPLQAGQTLFFDALTPHRSRRNATDRPRRALYPTYNAASEGDLRDKYYAEKVAVLAGGSNESRVRLSIIGDFEGIPV